MLAGVSQFHIHHKNNEITLSIQFIPRMIISLHKIKIRNFPIRIANVDQIVISIHANELDPLSHHQRSKHIIYTTQISYRIQSFVP